MEGEAWLCVQVQYNYSIHDQTTTTWLLLSRLSWGMASFSTQWLKKLSKIYRFFFFGSVLAWEFLIWLYVLVRGFWNIVYSFTKFGNAYPLRNNLSHSRPRSNFTKKQGKKEGRKEKRRYEGIETEEEGENYVVQNPFFFKPLGSKHSSRNV